MKNGLKVIVYYFLQGVLLTTPITITVYIIYILFGKIDGIIPFGIPGLGLATLFIFLTIVGYLGNLFISVPLTRWIESFLDRAPLIKTVYSSIKDLVSAFVGKEKRFNQPVLIQLSKDSNLQRIGFITREDLSILGITKDKVAVYIPHSYAWSGNTYVIDRLNITPIYASSADVMKFIISGGVSAKEEIVDENSKN